jgi:hypothetical protein
VTARHTDLPPAQRFREPFGKVVTLWLPRRFLTPFGVRLKDFIEDVNQKIRQRGMVLSNGELLATPLANVVESALVEPSFTAVDGHMLPQGCKHVGDYEVVYERGAEAPDSVPFAVPPIRDWHQPQKDFFGLENPYQMGEDAGDYTWSHVMTCVHESYLSPAERIVAVVDGTTDARHFYCPCHNAEVVYTTRKRVVCMGCGATHLVLRDALQIRPTRLLTVEEWIAYFDDSGSKRDEEVQLAVVDFCDLENAPAIWSTEPWEEAKSEFIFFARSSPDEIADEIRRTGGDPSILLEAGWTPVKTPLPPAHQLAANSISVDLVENACHALREGVRSFLAARSDSDCLVNAIPQLFRAVELFLKAKLRDVDTSALDDYPNNPAMLRRLAARHVRVSPDELETVREMRRLRNDLQHGPARFNYRTGLSVSRRAIIFIDRFAQAELGLWMGEFVEAGDWFQLLRIPEIAGTADRVLETTLEHVQTFPDATVALCSRCGKNAVIRPDSWSGASCVYCGHIPVKK